MQTRCAKWLPASGKDGHDSCRFKESLVLKIEFFHLYGHVVAQNQRKVKTLLKREIWSSLLTG